MSRDGEIMPDRNPAPDMAAISNTGPRSIVPTAKISTADPPKHAAATSPCRLVASATKPPANTPMADANKNPDSARLAADRLTPYKVVSATAE